MIGERGLGADALFYGLEAKARLTEHAFEVMGVLLDVGDELLEGASLLVLAGRLGDTIEADDRSAVVGGITTQRLFLNFQ